jgi:3-hydroxyisobutyrate dehydrogenase
MQIGFIGLGNVGGKLAGSLLRNGYDLTVRDLDKSTADAFLAKGAEWADSPKQLAEGVDVIITCLPSPKASAEVMEAEDGVIAGLSADKVWLEMSTTDEAEVKRLAEKVAAKGAFALDSPVSGGCHRAATGNIAIFAGGERSAFERVLPILTAMGREILHTGPLGSASILKVVTNYLASVHLVALGEAMTTAAKAGIDLNATYEAIRISSGNSFVHETESQVILNGSYDINFTMDLVLKDMSLFQAVAERADVPLELSPKVVEIFEDGEKKYGSRAWSSMIVKRLEDQCDIALRAPGFPAQMSDVEPEEKGHEVTFRNQAG